MQVRVLKAGLFNGPDHHNPVYAQPGDIIEVPGGWYAEGLLEQGWVSRDLHPAQSKPAQPSEQAAAAPDDSAVRRPRPTGRK